MCCDVKGCCGNGCKCTTSKIGKWLVIIGGLNWGLVGISMLLGSMSNWNLVELIFGSMRWLVAIIYLLVGISAVMMIVGCKCKKCNAGVCSVHGAGMKDDTAQKV